MTQKKISFLPIFLTVFIDMLGAGIVIPILAPLFLNLDSGIFPGSFSFSEKAFILGLMISAYPFSQFFGAPILGTLSDRYGRRIILLTSLLGSAIGYFFFG